MRDALQDRDALRPYSHRVTPKKGRPQAGPLHQLAEGLEREEIDVLVQLQEAKGGKEPRLVPGGDREKIESCEQARGPRNARQECALQAKGKRPVDEALVRHLEVQDTARTEP